VYLLRQSKSIFPYLRRFQHGGTDLTSTYNYKLIPRKRRTKTSPEGSRAVPPLRPAFHSTRPSMKCNR